MTRGRLVWLLAAAGVVRRAHRGRGDRQQRQSGETVPAGEWAQSVCGAVGVWRGELEDIVDDVRDPNSQTAAGSEEPQSETPQGRTGFIRKGLERAWRRPTRWSWGSTTRVSPSRAGRGRGGRRVGLGRAGRSDLEEAQDSLDDEADSLEAALEQFQNATGAIGATFVGGVQTLTDVAQLDPALAVAFRDASTCQQLREQRGR